MLKRKNFRRNHNSVFTNHLSLGQHHTRWNRFGELQIDNDRTAELEAAVEKNAVRINDEVEHQGHASDESFAETIVVLKKLGMHDDLFFATMELSRALLKGELHAMDLFEVWCGMTSDGGK